MPHPSHAQVFTPPANPSPNLQTVIAYIDALNSWDLDAISTVFADHLEHHILPASVGQPVLRSKKEYLAFFAGSLPLLRGFKLTIHELIEAKDKIIMHASSRANSTAPSNRAYRNEYVVIFHLESSPYHNDLPKIVLVKEFVDSKFSVDFFSGENALGGKGMVVMEGKRAKL